MRPTDPSLIGDYDHYPRIEAEFQAFLDQSLSPRGPELLYEIVGKLGLPQKGDVLDLGCGEGRFSIELASRFGFTVTGIDPVPRNIEVSSQRLAETAKDNPELRDLVRFERGTAEAVPLADASVDLIWCREVLVLIDDLDPVFAECLRVLRPAGRMLIIKTAAPTGLSRAKPSCLEFWEDSIQGGWEAPLAAPALSLRSSSSWAARSVSASRKTPARPGGACSMQPASYAHPSAMSRGLVRERVASCSLTASGMCTA
jgi:SAM-dependent methyltransferase